MEFAMASVTVAFLLETDTYIAEQNEFISAL